VQVETCSGSAWFQRLTTIFYELLSTFTHNFNLRHYSMAATLMTYAYLPFHEAYRAGCVNGCEGTFVTLNMHSVAHNYAAAAGSREITVGVGRAAGPRRYCCHVMRFRLTEATRVYHVEGDVAGIIWLALARGGRAARRVRAACSVDGGAVGSGARGGIGRRRIAGASGGRRVAHRAVRGPARVQC